MIYLASPYSHSDLAVRCLRYEQALAATVALMAKGKRVFSPITYSHQLHEAGLAGDWSFWRAFDESMIARCSFVWVLTLDGWRESVGVQAEIDIAAERGKPMLLVSLAECLRGGPDA